MAEQPPEREFGQRRIVASSIFMPLGIMFLIYSAIIFVFGIGLETIIHSNGATYGYSPSELASLLRLLAQPAIVIGLMLFFIGLANRTKQRSLHWLRITITTLCGILLGLAVLVALFMTLAVIIGSYLFP